MVSKKTVVMMKRGKEERDRGRRPRPMERERIHFVVILSDHEGETAIHNGHVRFVIGTLE